MNIGTKLHVHQTYVVGGCFCPYVVNQRDDTGHCAACPQHPRNQKRRKR